MDSTLDFDGEQCVNMVNNTMPSVSSTFNIPLEFKLFYAHFGT